MCMSGIQDTKQGQYRFVLRDGRPAGIKMIMLGGSVRCVSNTVPEHLLYWLWQNTDTPKVKLCSVQHAMRESGTGLSLLLTAVCIFILLIFTPNRRWCERCSRILVEFLEKCWAYCSDDPGTMTLSQKWSTACMENMPDFASTTLKNCSTFSRALFYLLLLSLRPSKKILFFKLTLPSLFKVPMKQNFLLSNLKDLLK